MINFIEPVLPEYIGGCQKFWFIPAGEIYSMPDAYSGKVASEIQTLPFSNWLTGYASPGSLQLEQQQENTPNGALYTVSVTGFFPTDSESMFENLRLMAEQKFVVLVADASGKIRIAGNTDEPLSFASRFSTRQLPSERPGYEFTFSGSQTEPCPAYTYENPVLS